MRANWTHRERLAALRSYDILDTPAEQQFDDLARIASHICLTPIALVTLVDHDRQWFKSEIGLGLRETSLEASICARAILQSELFVVTDAREDPRFNDNPLVIGPPYLRFYAGAILLTPEGLPLGTLCVLDTRPRADFSETQRHMLQALARQVMTQLELRRALGALRRSEATLQASNSSLSEQVEQRTAELRVNEESLRQSQKMEAVGQLTGGIAHDFNNLLQGIVGSIGVAQQLLRAGRAGEIEHFLSLAVRSAHRAAALTHRLLAFSRRQPLESKPTHVNQLIASTEDLLQRTLGESIRLELVLPQSMWLTLCDHNQLESALLNLAINARDAMPTGGTLSIETSNAQLEGGRATEHADVISGQYVCIAVTDTGVGMPADVAARAFDPFFTTKPSGRGTGLGLSMLYNFVTQSGGHARIFSEVGHGTTVKLYLPRFRGTLDTASAPPTEPAELAKGAETILVLEDESVVRELIVEVLSDLGYNVLSAADGPSGLEVISGAQHIDLLIADVGLPGLNGRQVAEAVRTAWPRLKILFMSGYADNTLLDMLGPGMRILSKPFAMEELTAYARRILDET